MRKHIKKEDLKNVKELDLLTYLMNYEPGELVKISRNVYSTKTHGSLKISNGMWTWWAKSVGGKSALDYFIKVKGYEFLEAAL
ncbi:MAG: topoisomerase, partial [Longicatena sp.]